MVNQGNEERSSPQRMRRLFQFLPPDVEDVEVYLVRLADGRIVARTAEELEEVEKRGATR